MSSTIKIPVSIIIPIYNKAEHLLDCLDSCRLQSSEHHEVILIDDGSTDDSYQISKDYIKKYNLGSIFTLHKKENGGASSARNHGLKKSKGEYILFLDADDIIHPEIVRTFYSVAKNKNASIVFGNNFSFSKEHSFNYDISENLSKNLPIDVIKKGFSGCGRLFRRDIFGDMSVLFPEGVWAEDNGYIPWLVSNASEILYVNSNTYGYRKPEKNNASLSTKSDDDIFKSTLYLYKIGTPCRLFKYTAIKNIFTQFRKASSNDTSLLKKIKEIESDSFFKEVVSILNEKKISFSDINDFEGKDKKYAKTIIHYLHGNKVKFITPYVISALSKKIKRLYK